MKSDQQCKNLWTPLPLDIAHELCHCEACKSRLEIRFYTTILQYLHTPILNAFIATNDQIFAKDTACQAYKHVSQVLASIDKIYAVTIAESTNLEAGLFVFANGLPSVDGVEITHLNSGDRNHAT